MSDIFKLNNQTVKKYWYVPPFVNSIYQYQDINNDVNLRYSVVTFFQKKIIKWIEKYEEFARLKPELDYYKSKKSIKHIFKLLYKYVMKTNINWYDLRSNYKIVKKYLSKTL